MKERICTKTVKVARTVTEVEKDCLMCGKAFGAGKTSAIAAGHAKTKPITNVIRDSFSKKNERPTTNKSSKQPSHDKGKLRRTNRVYYNYY